MNKKKRTAVAIKRKTERSENTGQVRFPLIKPKMSGIIVVNLRTGRCRIPRVGEVGIFLIDKTSDPSYADGKIVKRGDKR